MRAGYWRPQLDSLGVGLKVGISWRDGAVFTHRERQTWSLAALRSMLSVPGVRWINLQYGSRASELAELRQATGIEIVDWPEAIDGDYDETAALVGELDLVVSVCTAVAHLTGVLWRPAWVMTAKIPGWRYGRHGSSMPWYPRLRLFRQASQGDWGRLFPGSSWS